MHSAEKDYLNVNHFYKENFAMKKTCLVLAVLFALLISVLCVAAQDTITIVDHAGNEVTLPAEIKRIAVADIFPIPSVLAVFFDSAENLVGISPQAMAAAKNGLLSELYPEILNAETGWTDGTNVNVEELAKLEPDVVIYSAGNAVNGDVLRDAGFNAVGISAGKWGYDAIETLNQWIDLFSQMFPGNDRAETVRAYSEEVFAFVRERVETLTDDEREKVFFLFQYNDSTISTSGRKFFGQWWADAINAVNVGGELENEMSTAVNLEQVYAWNPDRILITNFNASTPDDLYNNTVGSYDWSGINAVINHKVNKMPLGMYRSYTCGVDTPVTLLWMAKTVYPQLFEDVDITQEAKDYYHEVFGITLSDEQVARIFAPAAEASAF